MSSKRLAASRAEGQTRIDDFQLVRGIGPGIEHRLHSAGIRTFGQLSAMTPEEVAALVSDVAGLSVERVVKLEWIEQARAFAAEHAANNHHSITVAAVPIQQVASPDHSEDRTTADQRQHLETFTVELLLDEENHVRRTSMVHIQEWKKEAWVGWDDRRVVRFLVERAGLPIAAKDISTPEQSQLPPMVVALAEPEVSVAESDPETLISAVAEADSSLLDTAALTPTALQAEVRPIGELRLSKLETLPEGANEPTSFFSHDQSFEVRLTLDMMHATVADPQRFDYHASVYAKSLNSRDRQRVGEIHGTLTLGATGTIRLPRAKLPPGIYRLEAAATLSSMSRQPGLSANLSAMLEGGLLRVY